jgi:hypothetical protein
MNACVRARPVAGPYCSAVARLSPPSPWRGSRGIWTRVVLSSWFPEPKRRCQSQPSVEEEEETDGSDVVRRGVVVSGNASAGRMSAEIEVKGKYSGLGRPASERCEAKHAHRRMIDKRTTGKGNQILAIVLLEALEGGQAIPACKVRKVVGMVYSVRALLPRHDGGCR